MIVSPRNSQAVRPRGRKISPVAPFGRFRAVGEAALAPQPRLLEERKLLAATFTVNSLLDQVDTSPTTTVTLRDAINEANQAGGGMIEFAADLGSEVNPGYGAGSSRLSLVGDNTFGPSALAVQPGVNITIAVLPGNGEITIERAASARPCGCSPSSRTGPAPAT